MSGETRAHHRRSSREAARRAREEIGVVVVCAWCDSEEHLAEARRVSHDTLIDLVGSRRRSGVTWRQFTGPDAVAALSELRAQATGDLADYYRLLAGKLREFGGWIVAASADAVGRPVEPRDGH